MSRAAVLPVVGNLAWAPIPSVDHVDIFDRFNGVPTLGTVNGSGGTHLFWRVAGHTAQHVTCWLYVPLDDADLAALEDCDGGDLLGGLVFDSTGDRYVTVGAAWDNRLIFEREWLLPQGLNSAEIAHAYLRFLAEALLMKVEQGLPASRLEMLKAASLAVQELATA